MDSKQLAAEIAWLADQKRGEDIQVLNVGDQLKVVDFFVLITGISRPHVKALFNEIHVRLKREGQTHKPPEGDDLGWWTVLDYGDVVVHIMQREARAFYDIENLYGECPQLDWRSFEAPAAPPESAAEV